jgi:redox-sensitive bicupin YhaK (pirin superfamily)
MAPAVWLALALALVARAEPAPQEPFASRRVAQTLLSVWQDEGAGARVRRSIGRPELRNFDPFLMLDEFSVGPPAGFPDHGHRGIETVTYMLDGSFAHEDFTGRRGLIGPGDLQWMTAGRGIMHSEMPASERRAHGLQLWVNLAAKDKFCEPAYQELPGSAVPRVTRDGVTAVVIAGAALGVSSPVHTRTPTHYLHFRLEPGAHLAQPVPRGWNAFLYTLNGTALVGPPDAQRAIEPHHTVTLDAEGDGVAVAAGPRGASFVLLSGQPLGEPIVQYGPVVMNSMEEVRAAFRDMRKGTNGFERAKGWRSLIGRPITDREL